MAKEIGVEDGEMIASSKACTSTTTAGPGDIKNGKEEIGGPSELNVRDSKAVNLRLRRSFF